MTVCRVALALPVALLASTVAGNAQQAAVQADSARAQIHTSLRAFYFNLAHQDWEALTADILAAKVVAHRPAPAALVAAAQSPDLGLPTSGSNHPACSSSATPPVDQAVMILDGDWAEVSVPRCRIVGDGADEFRLIYFAQRWRIVYIDLSKSR